jgi:hypothetical protein
MYFLPILLAIGIVIGALVDLKAAPVSGAGLSQAQITQIGAPVVQVQAKPDKKETIKQKVKRVWKNIAGYKFDVGCPIILPISRSTCTETGKNRADARAKCQNRNTFCQVSDAR